LESQFETLQPPEADENPVTVSIDASVDAIVDDIVRQFGLGALDGGAARRNRA
jgi:gluconokinase